MVEITYPPFGAGNLANPTALVGLAAVNGTALTAMRSDGAPALDQTAAFAFSGLAATTISQVAANATNFTITAATQTTNTTANPTISITRTNAVGAGNSAPAVLFVNLTNTSGSTGNKIFDFQTGGTTMLNLTVGGALVGSNDWTTAGQMQVGAAQRYTIGTDLILSRAGAARLRLGTSDAASPVAQQLEVQNAITGNNNGAATFTVVGPLSVGNGTSGDTVFSTGKNGNGSGVLATITEALRIKGETQAVVVASGKTFQIGNAAVTGLTPGVFAATTDATIVITDANGQAYRVAAKI